MKLSRKNKFRRKSLKNKTKKRNIIRKKSKKKIKKKRSLRKRGGGQGKKLLSGILKELSENKDVTEFLDKKFKSGMNKADYANMMMEVKTGEIFPFTEDFYLNKKDKALFEGMIERYGLNYDEMMESIRSVRTILSKNELPIDKMAQAVADMNIVSSTDLFEKLAERLADVSPDLFKNREKMIYGGGPGDQPNRNEYYNYYWERFIWSLGWLTSIVVFMLGYISYVDFPGNVAVRAGALPEIFYDPALSVRFSQLLVALSGLVIYFGLMMTFYAP